MNVAFLAMQCRRMRPLAGSDHCQCGTHNDTRDGVCTNRPWVTDHAAGSGTTGWRIRSSKCIWSCRGSWRTHEDIERDAERARSIAAAVAAQRLADGFNVGTELQRDAACDRRITRRGIGVAAGLVVAQENFADTAIGKARDRCGVFEAGAFQREGFAGPPVRKGMALGHDAVAMRTNAARFRSANLSRGRAVVTGFAAIFAAALRRRRATILAA